MCSRGKSADAWERPIVEMAGLETPFPPTLTPATL